jgi:hypothetical protein
MLETMKILSAPPRRRLASVALLAAVSAVAAGHAALPAPQTESINPAEIVLFPFDNYSLPFNKGLALTMVAGSKHKRQDPRLTNAPVLAIGKPGDPDFPRAYFSGTVIKVNGLYRMWYTGHDGRHRQVCYAESKDGLEWEKPKLGLVDYKGSRANNLVALDGPNSAHAAIVLVIHDPEDPDPSRRYKMLREDAVPGVSWKNFAAASPDGLSWTSLNGGKFVNASQWEPSGLVRHNGAYYVNGHSRAIVHPLPGAHKRTMQTFVSYDFENWTSAAHLSFRRDNLPPRPPTDFEGHRGPQVHLGASLWNRGNVILGFYGMYDNPTNDRRTSTCDIGLIVSNNAINFREPLPEFKIVPSFEEPDRAEPRLTQGQAFENIGDRTVFYYGIWTEVNRNGPTGVRIATWPRDRLGYYSSGLDITDAHCISAPLTAHRPDARIYLNAGGLGPDSQLKVEILDEQFRPLPGYAAADCTPFPTDSGFRLPVTWKGSESLAELKQPVRVRVNFTGRDAHRAKLYAIYLE